MNNAKYESSVLDFYKKKFEYDKALHSLSMLNKNSNNPGSGNKKKINKQKSHLEKKITKANTFEITPQTLIMYGKDNKIIKKIVRMNNEEIGYKLKDIKNKKHDTKSSLLKLKNEILYELVNLELGEEKFKEYDDYEFYINHYQKKEEEIRAKHKHKMKSLEEEENELRIKISEIKELLKTETEPNEKKKYLIDYAKFLNEIQFFYEKKNKVTMLEVRNDEGISRERIIEKDLNVISLDDGYEIEKQTKNNS